MRIEKFKPTITIAFSHLLHLHYTLDLLLDFQMLRGVLRLELLKIKD